jgi:hypothetical protein
MPKFPHKTSRIRFVPVSIVNIFGRIPEIRGFIRNYWVGDFSCVGTVCSIRRARAHPNQALSALLLLHREAPGAELP